MGPELSSNFMTNSQCALPAAWKLHQTGFRVKLAALGAGWLLLFAIPGKSFRPLSGILAGCVDSFFKIRRLALGAVAPEPVARADQCQPQLT